MPQKNRAKILVVDDDTTQMKAVCETLLSRSYDTTGYSSAPAALEEIVPGRFDLLLTDLMMPEMDGIALLKEAQQKDPSLVGVIMTGEGTIETAVTAMQSGALDYVLKPFRLSVVLPVLERALEMRLLRLQNMRLEEQVRERAVELEAANKSLAIANRELEAYSFSVSHDLHAPLRSILGYVDALTEEGVGSLPDEQKHYLRRIATLAREMTDLITDLLEFSRMSHAEIHREKVDLQELVKDVIESLRPDYDDRTVLWEVGKLLPVQADASLIRQVLVNLLLNAIKYTRPRNPAKIEIGGTSDQGEVVIFVRDNGVGFDMRNVEKLFGVFQRLHRRDEFEGTGIGLANVRRIISRHGGRTWAEGRVGEGATFSFSLPR